MPTYGYRCQSCGSEFEVLQRMSDPPEAACPSCSGAGKRLFYPAGILFKGSGFYKTDSRSTSAATVNGSGSTSDDGKPAGSTGKAGPAAPASTPSEAGTSPTPAPSKDTSGSAAAPKPAAKPPSSD